MKCAESAHNFNNYNELLHQAGSTNSNPGLGRCTKMKQCFIFHQQHAFYQRNNM